MVTGAMGRTSNHQEAERFRNRTRIHHSTMKKRALLMICRLAIIGLCGAFTSCSILLPASEEETLANADALSFGF